MIYITGDCHGDFNRFATKNYPEQKCMDKSDYVIICGDFGCVWDYKGENIQERYWLDWLEGKPWTTLFVDGNHENFERLNKYPVKEYCGGKVHEIRSSVLHMIRGNVFDISGKTIFTFGGGRSHDICDGILEPIEDRVLIKKWSKDVSKHFRVNGITWWKEEMPSEEEMQHGKITLEKNNWKVDFIVTHDCAASTKALIGHGAYKVDELNCYLEEIRQKCDYKKWFFGHLHNNRQINSQEILLYEQIIRIC